MFSMFSQQQKQRQQQRVTAPQQGSIPTCQHNPAESSSPVTHIRLSASQRRCSNGSSSLEDSLVLSARVDSAQSSQIGRKMSWNCCFTKFFFWLSTAVRGSLSQSGRSPARTGGAICPTVCGYEPIDSEICSRSSGAVTHQGAVVQEGCGEVAAEAESQDVALPGA